MNTTLELLLQTNTDTHLATIIHKIADQERINDTEALFLYENAPLSTLTTLANYIREKKHGNYTYFNKNFHVEPTNICVFDCKFCSYSRLLKNKEDGWEKSIEDMLDTVRKYIGSEATEVHIVGGVHPKMTLEFFGELLSKIKEINPVLHIKAFTAVELEYMFRKAKKTYKEGLEYLISKGLQSLPGGGAEIFNETIRLEIAGDKCTSEEWLQIHETAHQLGLHSNATMLYGHIETYAHRIEHMRQLRDLQDKTGMFQTFIPLKFRNQGNQMSHIKEVTSIEDIKAYAMARIYMDNFAHIKAYWPMIGREMAQLLLHIGVDDLDGTIDDSTKIYSMAGSSEQNPALTTEELIALIKQARRTPIERDTLYNVLHEYAG